MTKQEALKELERGGRIRPDDLIRVARDPNHPCHEDFTWDDAKAAEERRHDQARALIRCFRYEVELVGGEKVAVPCYIPDPSQESGDFVNVPKLRKQSDIVAMFDAELRQLLGVASRVLGIAESKREVVGADVVGKLLSIRNAIKGMLRE